MNGDSGGEADADTEADDDEEAENRDCVVAAGDADDAKGLKEGRKPL